MAFRLPPLNALRTLEAAGRLMSFARAAEELNVTPGAVSRQIRVLEESLGFPVFDRHYREVRMNADGAAYIRELGECFRHMERVTKRLVEQRGKPVLQVHIAITFTLRWLVPRLAAFHARHPCQQIRLSTATVSDEDLAASSDVVLRMMTNAEVAALPNDFVAHKLYDIDLVPVCSPALMAGRKAEDFSLLATHSLLHSNARPHDWGYWLQASGQPTIDAQAAIFFESSSLAYQAAVEGVGVAIGMRRLVESDLLSGRLVTPFRLHHRPGVAFYILHAAKASSSTTVTEFRDWVIDEASRERLSPD
jgi:LysR family glycine cleavage system transcriptional activator